MDSAPQNPATLANALGTTRDRATSGDSSRSLLMTVLGEFVLPSEGEAWTQTILEAMNLVGVKEKTARQTMARLHQQQRLDKRRVGRQTRWSLSPSTRSVLEAGAGYIYNFGRVNQPWDGRWAVLLASVPESDRGTRYRMSVRLRWAGFGTPEPGIWISPWTSREPEATRGLRQLEVHATSFLAEIGSLGDGITLSAKAWDLPTLRIGYEDFLTETNQLERSVNNDRSAAAALTMLVHQWRQFPFADPDLPHELLPGSWPRAAAAQRFSELRAQLQPAAARWWAETEAKHARSS